MKILKFYQSENWDGKSGVVMKICVNMNYKHFVSVILIQLSWSPLHLLLKVEPLPPLALPYQKWSCNFLIKTSRHCTGWIYIRPLPGLRVRKETQTSTSYLSQTNTCTSISQCWALQTLPIISRSGHLHFQLWYSNQAFQETHGCSLSPLLIK